MAYTTFQRLAKRLGVREMARTVLGSPLPPSIDARSLVA